jgi:hypothetical protein
VDPATITSLGDWVGGWLERNPLAFLTMFFFGTTCFLFALLLRCSGRNADIIQALTESKDARIVALERQIEAKEKDTRILEALNNQNEALQSKIENLAGFIRATPTRRKKLGENEAG